MTLVIRRFYSPHGNRQTSCLNLNSSIVFSSQIRAFQTSFSDTVFKQSRYLFFNRAVHSQMIICRQKKGTGRPGVSEIYACDLAASTFGTVNEDNADFT